MKINASIGDLQKTSTASLVENYSNFIDFERHMSKEYQMVTIPVYSEMHGIFITTHPHAERSFRYIARGNCETMIF